MSVCAFAHAHSAEGVITSGSATLFFPGGKIAVMDYGFDTNLRQVSMFGGNTSSHHFRAAGLRLWITASTPI